MHPMPTDSVRLEFEPRGGGKKRTQIKVVMLRQRGRGTMQQGAHDGSHQGVTVSHYGGSFLHALRRHEHILSVLRGERSHSV